MQALLKGQVAKLPAQNIRNDNFFQRTVLSWVYNVVGQGRRGQLQQEQLMMPADQATEVASDHFQRNWNAEVKANPSNPSLVRAMRHTFGWEFALAGLFKLLWSAFVLMGASFFVKTLIEFVQKKGTTLPDYNALDNKGVGWILACAFFVDAVLSGISLQRMGDVSVRVGIKIRAALMTAVYRKTFRLNSASADNSGSIVSLVSTDCAKLYEGVQHLHNVWTAPVEAAVIIGVLMYWTGGVYGVPALGVVLVVLPLQYFFGYKIAMYKMENVEVSDARVLRMHEVLLAIKLVKFYVWEKSFADQVELVRQQEVALIMRTAVIKTLNLCLVFAVPPIIALVIFATYSYNVHPIKADIAFVVLSLFNTLRFPLVVLPKALRGASEAVAATSRVQKFLLLDETEAMQPSETTEARMEDAELHYGDPNEYKLRVPKFEVNPGEVVAIVGRVGSGKSSVLQAILSKMTVSQGNVHVGGRIAYVPQTPWVQNLSLRDNILFGLPYDEAKYKEVIHACALELDLKILPNGDNSMAGERGINLSGGQRQRVCLARAAYHDADMVLLDNPLSAVDQHTSKHIFDYCIKGLLKHKAVVLVAHQLELLPQCHKVAILKDSTMVYFGPPDAEAISHHMPMDGGLQHATVEGKENATAAATNDHGDKAHAATEPEDESAAIDDGSTIKAKREHRRQPSCVEAPEEILAKFNGTAKRLPPAQAAMVYLRSGGVVLGLGSAFIFAFTQTTRIIGDWWIRAWAADNPGNFYKEMPQYEATTHYLLIYMGLVIAFVCLLLVRDGAFSVWSIRASTNLHNKLFRSVLGAPILFFLRTPLGDVLNAFARDQDTLDETLPDVIHMTGIYLMILLTSLSIVTVSIHYYAAMTGALFLSFALMQRLYLPAATVLKRWAGDTASHVFVHVDESLHGMDVIRAFGAVEYFLQENVQRINRHHLALFNTEQTHLWLAFWCDFFGALLVVATCLLSVAFSEELGPANVGLAISNSIQVLVFFTWVVRGVADTVSMWDAVERATSFATGIPSEINEAEEASKLALLTAAKATNAGTTPLLALTDGKAAPGAAAAGAGGDAVLAVQKKASLEVAAVGVDGALRAVAAAQAGEGGKLESIKVVGGEGAGQWSLEQWPQTGDLRFEGVCLRYFPGGPLALRYVTFHIHNCEKVGIVGRTGSGKTTLLMGLFRLLDLAAGRVLVDGVDLAALPLREVRKRISIIPQEPVMFKGTVRSNLDPFNEASDNELWHTLALVHLKPAIADLPGGLDAAVTEGGSNFSLGQKQLICMARCVLKKTKILVLDEATAAMDLQTDALIQKTIRRVFKGRTTLTIAHRLDTIIFSDKILSMGQGEVKELDTPQALLQNPDSMFNKLVEDTGEVASAALRQMAAQGPQDDEPEELQVRRRRTRSVETSHH